jgi:polar amino acid transport system substrate-binding protein
MERHMTVWKRALVIIALWVAAFAPAAAQDDLRVGIAAEPYPPFASKDASGTWVGWEIDVMNALCAELEAKCTIVEIAWDGIIPALDVKKIDIIFASMAITAERKKKLAFSRWYYNSSVSMIASKGVKADISSAALSGRIIGVQLSTISAAYATKHFGASSEIKSYKSLDDATADLAAGRVDVVQGETNALESFLVTEAGAACCVSLGRVAADSETLGEGVGAGLRKDDDVLKQRIDDAIAVLATSGKLKKITSAYPMLVTGIVLPE